MPNRTGFQTFVNNELPIAVPGDFASANPRASVVGGPGQYVAPLAGTTVGNFAWFDPTTGLATNYFKPNSFLGFIHRENQGLITQFLGIATLQVVPGNMVTGMEQGDFYGTFAAGAAVKQKVYADPVTGALTAGATGGSVTGSYTATTVTAGVMTTTDANLTGTAAAVGQVVTGGTLPEGTYIASSAGTGSGTHLWNLANLNGTVIPDQGSFTSTETGIQETHFTVASTVAVDAIATGSSIAATGILTVGSVTQGAFSAGQFLSGTGIPGAANAQILYAIDSTHFQTSYNAVVSSTTITASEGKIGAITSWA
jgi:hypothetical protein